MQRKGVGRIEQVFRKLGGERRLRLGDFLEARLFVVWQFRAGKSEVAQLVGNNLSARRVQARVGRAVAQCFVTRKEAQVLAQVGPKLGDFGQVLVVGIAQGLVVVHRVQMPNDAPSAPQALCGFLERQHKAVPCGRGAVGCDALNRGARIGDELCDGRANVVGFDRVKARQVGEVEERIHGEINKR